MEENRRSDGERGGEEATTARRRVRRRTARRRARTIHARLPRLATAREEEARASPRGASMPAGAVIVLADAARARAAPMLTREEEARASPRGAPVQADARRRRA